MNVKEVMTRQMITDRFRALLEKAASLSLTDEVAATPKPGLVDRKDNGAHSDMDYLTFEDSIRAILPFIKEMAGIGASWGDKMSEESPDKAAGCLFKAIRLSGVKAEKAMFAATGGVNTHKGIIFSMGLAAASAGFLFCSLLSDDASELSGKKRCPVSADDILFYCGKMCRASMERDFSEIEPGNPKSHGEYLYLKYGIRGIRGEAADSFPAVRNFGLPALREFLSRPENGTNCGGGLQNRLSLHILLNLMANVDDTNVLFRTDYASLEYVKQCAFSVLLLGGAETPEGINELVRLNEDFIKRNISPGGCADLLSMTLFLWRLELIIKNMETSLERNNQLWPLTELL